MWFVDREKLIDEIVTRIQVVAKPAPTPAAPSTEAEFDIEGRDVYGIDRLANGQTNFDWIADNGEHWSWTCQSTDEQHKAFVNRLTVKLAEQNADPISSATSSE